jgi:putative flippase GtrA
VQLTRPVVRQALRFGIVGLANTVVCLAIVWTLEGSFSQPVWLASAAGYTVATAQSYILNRIWTFEASERAPVGSQFLRFIIVNIVVGAIFSALTSLLAPAIDVRLASLAALTISTVLSFLAMRVFVFGRSA